MRLKEITEKVVEISNEAGSVIRNNMGKLSDNQISVKGLNDYVTEIDKASEKIIVEKLSLLLPEAGFIAEEGTSNKIGEEYNWIIDPLDGTTNFIHGIYPCAVSIALEYKTEIVLGVVYEVGLDECFYAWKDGGAYLNKKPIKVSNEKSLKNSLIATGFPYHEYKNIDRYIDLLKYFTINSKGIRRLGSAATDMAYVACGRLDAFYEYDLKPYDVAAGSIIVSEAVGKNSDFSGTGNYIYGKEIACANKNIFDDFLKIINNFMKK